MEKNQFNWTQYAKKLRTVVADTDDADLTFFIEDLQGVKIVALGESTHGSREIFQMKHRMISYLVRKQGFRVVSIEAGIEPCRNIDAFVRYGVGDPKKALSSQSYWTWDTIEVMGLLEWMRSYNLNCIRGEECRFAGFDMKPIEGACDNLRRLILGRTIPEADKALGIIAACRDVIWYHGEPQTLPDVLWLNGWIAIHRHDLRRFCSEETLWNTLEDARYVSQFVISVEENQSQGSTTGFGVRDEFMAKNIKRIMDENPNEKLIVWAHNGHIAKNDQMRSLGWHLKNEFGSQYYSAGILMGAGGFQSRDMKTMQLMSYMLKEPLPETWERELFESFNKQNWFIQLRKGCVESESFYGWAKRVKPSLEIGSAYAYDLTEEDYNKNFIVPISLADQFDGIFYLGQVQRARPNLSGQR
jgi:erythromycin esterase